MNGTARTLWTGRWMFRARHSSGEMMAPGMTIRSCKPAVTGSRSTAAMS